MSESYHISLPNHLQGTISLPASKSISARALIIAALAGDTHLENLSDCDDTLVLRRALSERSAEIDIHAAGTAMRFGTAFFAVTPGEHVLTGTARMQQRPIRLLVDALRTLGADIEYVCNAGFPPLRIRGRHLEGGQVSIPANVSSQYISALLLVAPTMKRGLTLQLEGEVVSTPYIDMTLNLMQQFGAQAAWRDDHTLEVLPVPYEAGHTFQVEPDWSGASYWYELVALSPDGAACIHLPGLRPKSVQGDSVVCSLFEPLGVKTTFTPNGITLTKAAAGKDLLTDFTKCPDLAQTLVATCAALGRPFHFTGLQSLKIKETDRIVALQNELAKLGRKVEANDREMWYDGNQSAPQHCPAIDTYDDHRMAMALAPCARMAPDLIINNPEVVCKSYPAFWDDLKRIGTQIKVK